MSDSTSLSDDALLRAIAADSELDVPEAMPERVGRFVIERELGRGGMGIVYRARDERLDRTIALKVLGKRRDSDPERRARFLREARSAASIVHPNVATVYEIGEERETPYIAMELVDGTSLRQRLLVHDKLPVAEVIALASGITRGLAAAHEKQIIHRDLKPENIMVEPSGSPKILDFGLAKLHDADVTPTELGAQATRSPSTEDGRILGTPGYMSPEQAAGKALDGRSDLFSLGVVLYEALTGRRPFAFESSAEAIAAVLRDEPTPLRRLRPEIPAALAQLVMECLAKAPAARPADAHAVLARLEVAPTSPRPRSRGVFYVGVAMIALVIAFVASRRAAPPPPSASAPADAAPSQAASMTTLPLPRTTVPAAAAAYAAGLTSIRDGAWELGAQSFFRAAKLDPALAAAHLRAGLYGFWVGLTGGVLPSQARESVVMAARFRGSLDERDLALLHIAEAGALDPPDYAQIAIRSREAAARYPSDVVVARPAPRARRSARGKRRPRRSLRRLWRHRGSLEEREASLCHARKGEGANEGAQLRPLNCVSQRFVTTSPGDQHFDSFVQ